MGGGGKEGWGRKGGKGGKWGLKKRAGRMGRMGGRGGAEMSLTPLASVKIV